MAGRPAPPLQPFTGAGTEPLSAPAQAFLTHLQVQRQLAERTLQMYAAALQRLEAAARTSRVALQAVQPFHVRGWSARLHGQGLGPRSIAIHLAAWRGFYRWLGRQGEVELNPVEGLRAPRAARLLPKALPVDQAVALAAFEPAVPADAPEPSPHQQALERRDHAITELLYSCGLRVSELVGLDWRYHAPPQAPASHSWLDLEAGDVHVRGKGGKRRTVPVGGPARAALQAWLAVREQVADLAEPALFVSQQGRRLTDGQLRRRLASRAQAAGLDTHVHPHMLRHSFASHLLQSSGDLRAVQDLMGHARISTTQVYTRLDFQHLAKIYDATHPRAKARPPDGSATPGAADSDDPQE